ncbi:glycogenin-1-like [Haemaphysalis longicornis]
MQSQEEVAGLKQSWVTLATNDIYAIGAVVLGYSLREAKTSHKLTVLVNEDVGDVTRHLLGQVFDEILPLTQLSGADTPGGPERAGDEVTCSDTKLHVWRLLHLNKCVFLDADTLVLSNCDDLFDRQELAAAPVRGWPDLFDTGVFVFEPSDKTHAQVIEAARNNAGFHGLDRDVLNAVFGSKWKNDLSLQLPFLYNLQSSAGRPFYDEAYRQYGASETKIVHFWGFHKPWTQPYNRIRREVHPAPGCPHHPEHLQKWWQVFCRHVLPELTRYPCGDGQKPEGSSKADVPPTDEHRRDDVESDDEEYEGLGTFLNIQRLLDVAVKAATPQADEEDDDFPDPASSLDSSFSDDNHAE